MVRQGWRVAATRKRQQYVCWFHFCQAFKRFNEKFDLQRPEADTQYNAIKARRQMRYWIGAETKYRLNTAMENYLGMCSPK